MPLELRFFVDGDAVEGEFGTGRAVEFTDYVRGFRIERRVDWHKRVQDVDRAHVVVDASSWAMAAFLRYGHWCGVSYDRVAVFEGFLIRADWISIDHIEFEFRGYGELLEYEIESPALENATFAVALERVMRSANEGSMPLPTKLGGRRYAIVSGGGRHYWLQHQPYVGPGPFELSLENSPSTPMPAYGGTVLRIGEGQHRTARAHLEALIGQYFGWLQFGPLDRLETYPSSERVWGLVYRGYNFWRTHHGVNVTISDPALQHTRSSQREGFGRYEMTRKQPEFKTGASIYMAAFSPVDGGGQAFIRPTYYMGRRIQVTRVGAVSYDGPWAMDTQARVVDGMLEVSVRLADVAANEYDDVPAYVANLAVEVDGWLFPQGAREVLPGTSVGGQMFKAPDAVWSSARCQALLAAWRSTLLTVSDWVNDCVIEDDPGGAFFRELFEAGGCGAIASVELYSPAQRCVVSAVEIDHMLGGGVTQTRLEFMPYPDVSELAGVLP